MTTAGDIIYASGANTPARLAKDTNSTRVLTNTGTSNVPAWAQVTLTSGVTGTLPVGNGGTGATTLTDGGVLLGNGTGTVVAMSVLADSEMIVGDGTTDPVAESGATLRTSIGVGTGDSPEFTGLTLSGALDANGSVDFDGTTVDVDASGAVTITSTSSSANGIYLQANGGTSETVKIHADQGTAATEGAASVQLLSDVGGIGIKSGLNAAGAIRLTADAGTSETIEIHADQGSGTASINLVSDAGGITLNPSSLVTVTGTVNIENAAAGIVMRFKDTDSTGTAVNQYFVFQGSDDAVVGYIGKTSTGQMYLFNESSTNTILGAGGLTRLTIASNGTFTGSASNDISDSRIKENIEDTPVGLAEIMRLRPVRYNFQAGKGWGEPDQKFYGLLAQEVEGVIPEAVHTEIIDIDEVVAGKKHDVNGITDLKSVSMSQITAALIKAVQELKAEIEELKA